MLPKLSIAIPCGRKMLGPRIADVPSGVIFVTFSPSLLAV